MKSLGRYALRLILRTCARIGWYEPFLWILTRAIVEHPASKAKGGKRRPTLLALSPEGFRGDPEVLSEAGHFRVLLAPTRWQTRLMYLFYPEGLRSRDYLNPEPSSPYMDCKKNLQAFYRELLPRLYARLGIDAVISYHVRAPADVDWGMASDQTGYPYVVLYREGLIASAPSIRDLMSVRFGRFGFWGTHLVVHNESARQFCIDTGFVPPAKVSSLGCLRMDGFIRRVRQQKNVAPGRRKKVTLFPISVDAERDTLPISPFDGVHVGFSRLALKHPDVEFVLKPKPKVYGHWRKSFDAALESAGIDTKSPPNLVIDANLDAQSLILSSDVVCGINTTTLLEAAVAGKPVVVPYFDEFRVAPYRNGIRFVDAFQYMDVANDVDSFVSLIEKRLQDPVVSPEEMAGRRAMFEKYVSDPDGHALEKYTQLLDRVIDQFGKQRMSVTLDARSAAASLQAEDITP